MPCTAWRDWRQVAETFVAERPGADPAAVVEVLLLVLTPVDSWADLIGAGSWVQCASTEVYTHDVPGFGVARTYSLLDRFTEWLHGRGDITPWQRDVMRSEIDLQRGAHGGTERGVPRVRELRFGFEAERISEAWVRSIGDGRDRKLARASLRVLVSQLHLQLGECGAPPLGSLDADEMVSEVIFSSDVPLCMADRALFAVLAAFYRWLAEEGHLEPSRAHTIAGQLATAALGMAA